MQCVARQLLGVPERLDVQGFMQPDGRLLHDLPRRSFLQIHVPQRSAVAVGAGLQAHVCRWSSDNEVRGSRTRMQRTIGDVRHLDRVHRYQRLDALASGGMGTVYLGRMIAGATVHTVAIKVLHPHLATDADMVAMFLDEARVATRLRHPNLVGVLDMDMLGEELVIVMEYVEGSTLGTMQSALRRRNEKLPVGLSVRIVCDALAGLHEVHELVDEKGQPLGLVHRDVSPHNLLVGSDGITRVTDFGIALGAGRLASTRADGTVKGKLQYLAPEQAGRKRVDRRVDVFAAGIVLWECLTGERLFEAPTEAETVTRVLRDPIAPPSMRRPEVSTDLDEVCLQALERDPDRRYKTAAQFADALRSAVDSLPEATAVGLLVCNLAADAIRTQRDSLKRASLVPSRPRWRRRLLPALAVACVLLGVAAALFAFPSRRPASTSTDRASPPVASAVSIDEPWKPAPTVSAQPSPEPDVASAPPARNKNPAVRSTGIRAAPGKPAAKTSRPFMPDDL
jgi:serine/threonine protein kinase